MTPTLPEWLDFVEKYPHEFTIQYPPRREYFIQNFRLTQMPPVREWLSESEELLLYLHVPFCDAKCHYCNFAVDVTRDRRVQSQYVDALLCELESHADWLQGRRVLGLDIGGGTPTSLPKSELARIVNEIRPFLSQNLHPSASSIESTPRIAAEEPEKLEALRAAGINRVSLGIQSFNGATLTSLNRQRQIEMADRAMTNLRLAGFLRINLDVIFGLPGQSLEEWQQDLEHLISLAPDSITTYDCLYRGAGRAFGRRTHTPPKPETYGAMYDRAYETLGGAGWHASYGSTNFCRYPSETGTSAYFEGRLLDGKPFLGLGNYATSMRDNFWSFNVQSVAKYLDRITMRENPCEFVYEVPPVETQAKYILWSLNFGFIDENRFARRFGSSFGESFTEELTYALECGWLEHCNSRWQIKPNQFNRMHAIRSLFYTKEARQWLMNSSVQRYQML